MKKIIVSILGMIGVLLCVTGCRSRQMPEDFQISFQFGTTDADTVTMDTYNKLITLGTDQKTMKMLPLNLGQEEMSEIYNELMENEVHTWKEGNYRGSIISETPNIKFSIKFISNKRTKIISGDGSTSKYQNKSRGKDPEKLVLFRDYMVEFIQGLDEYRELTG